MLFGNNTVVRCDKSCDGADYIVGERDRDLVRSRAKRGAHIAANIAKLPEFVKSARTAHSALIRVSF
jgi:hypothetical protein